LFCLFVCYFFLHIEDVFHTQFLPKWNLLFSETLGLSVLLSKNKMHFYMKKAVSVLADRNRKQVILAFTLGHTILHS